jgi:hypothetical protein
VLALSAARIWTGGSSTSSCAVGLPHRPLRTTILDRFRLYARIGLVTWNDRLFDFTFQQALDIAQQLPLIDANQ